MTNFWLFIFLRTMSGMGKFYKKNIKFCISNAANFFFTNPSSKIKYIINQILSNQGPKTLNLTKVKNFCSIFSFSLPRGRGKAGMTLTPFENKNEKKSTVDNLKVLSSVTKRSIGILPNFKTQREKF